MTTYAQDMAEQMMRENVASARRAFGHIDGADDVMCLSLMVAQLKRHLQEERAHSRAHGIATFRP